MTWLYMNLYMNCDPLKLKIVQKNDLLWYKLLENKHLRVSSCVSIYITKVSI